MCDLLTYRDDDCHVIYKNLFIKAEGNVGRQLKNIHRAIAEMWDKFKPLANQNFISDFPKQPDQRYWEMYLGCCLLDFGFHIQRGEKGPDFQLRVMEEIVWIEAIAPTIGNGKNQIPTPLLLSEGGTAQKSPKEEIILRYRSGLDEKAKKFKLYEEKGLVAQNDIKLIALSSAMVRGWNKSDTLPYILNAIFPIGDPYVLLDHNDGEQYETRYHFQPPMKNKNGAVVEPFFSDLNNSNISAIIYGGADIGNPPEQRGADLLIIHNPFATKPLPFGSLRLPIEYWFEDTKDGGFCVTKSSPNNKL